MTQKHDGGPAFPSSPQKMEFDGEGFRPVGFEGMSLRDYFAGQAMNALIEDVNRPSDPESGDSDIHPRDEIARRAYALADAMIAARSGGDT